MRLSAGASGLWYLDRRPSIVEAPETTAGVALRCEQPAPLRKEHSPPIREIPLPRSVARQGFENTQMASQAGHEPGI